MSDYIEEIRGLIGSRPFILVGSAVLVFNRNYEVLLQLRTDTGKWGIPGGAMEPGESFEETARRELFEETGLHLKRLKFLDVAAGEEYYFQYPNGDEIFNAIALYACEDWEGNLKMNDGESKELRFFPLKSLPSLTERQGLIISKLKDSGLLPEFREISLNDIMECAEVLDLQRKSYKIEADLIGTDQIPTLKETFEQLQDCGETFIGCFLEGRLAGAISFKKEEQVIDIHRMMVHPDFFRRGIAGMLLSKLEQIACPKMIVSTGASNTPAVRLYEKFGFERQHDSVVGGGLVLAHFEKKKI